MSNWIDYDAIDYRFDRIQDESPDFIGGVIYANACVMDAPSIDIVRCKECKHYFYDELNDCKMCYIHEYGEIWEDDDFCSYGEREGE